jgi:hypothetical protein
MPASAVSKVSQPLSKAPLRFLEKCAGAIGLQPRSILFLLRQTGRYHDGDAGGGRIFL